MVQNNKIIRVNRCYLNKIKLSKEEVIGQKKGFTGRFKGIIPEEWQKMYGQIINGKSFLNKTCILL